MTKTLKTQKTQIIDDKTTVIHRIVKSGILDGLERVMLRTCVHSYLTFLAFLLHLYLITIKHASTLHYKHVDHATFALLYSHGIYLYKLVSRVSCTLPSL